MKTLLTALAAVPTLAYANTALEQTNQAPNIIIIYCDDMGYGDLSCYGNPSIKTPVLDRMAVEGQKWSSFYTPASVSTPSRAGLMTGRYPYRISQHEVYFPETAGGLANSELTLPEMLKAKGYTNALVGKWHLGHQKAENLPLNHGFDTFYGIPFSNDMSAKEQHILGNMNYSHKLPFYHDNEIIEWESDQSLFTRRLTEHSRQFIRSHSDRPFFLMLAHPMPHIPIYSSEEFRGRSDGGRYGDTIEEIDWSVGEIMAQLKESGIEDNTIVMFSSDNGPWLITKYESGSAGVLRDGKASAYEGGFRVPFIVWGEMIEPATITTMGCGLDIMPTIAQIIGYDLPSDIHYDGVSLASSFTTGAESPREGFIFYRVGEVYAARLGDYKAIYATKPTYTAGKKIVYATPELYNVAVDPSEKYNIAADHPEIITQINQYLAEHEQSLLQDR